MVQPTGEYIIFAAGTGVLCYLDLVMQLALSNLGIADIVNVHRQEKLDLAASRRSVSPSNML